MLRIAFVGTGWWGKELAKAAASLPERFVIAGCTALTEPERAQFCAAFGGRSYPSYDAVLADGSVDAVLLATPHTAHAPQIIAAAAAGKHVFCEKPLTLTVTTAQQAIGACEAKGVTLGIGHNRRYSRVARTMKAMIEAGACGRILHIEANYSSPGATRLAPGQWRAQREEAPGGGIAPMGLHMIDTLTWLAAPIVRLASICKRQVVAVDIDDTSATLFELENGATGSLGCVFACPMVSYLRLYGTKANLEARDNFAELAIEPLAPDQPLVRHRFGIDDTLPAELLAFAEACEGGADFPVRPAEALHNVAVMAAIAASAAAGGEWVTIPRAA